MGLHRYYRVKKEHDGAEVWRKTRKGNVETSNLIGDELVTFTDMLHWHIPVTYVDEIDVDNKYIYWLFGARFLSEKAEYVSRTPDKKLFQKGEQNENRR